MLELLAKHIRQRDLGANCSTPLSRFNAVSFDGHAAQCALSIGMLKAENAAEPALLPSTGAGAPQYK